MCDYYKKNFTRPNLKYHFQIRSSKKMDSVRHRGRSRLSTKSFDPSPTSLNFATSAFDDDNTVELSNIDKIVDKRLRSSKSEEYNRNPLDSKQTCHICIATSFKSKRSLSDSETNSSECKINSILLKHDSSNVIYVKKKMVISGKKVILVPFITQINFKHHALRKCVYF